MSPKPSPFRKLLILFFILLNVGILAGLYAGGRYVYEGYVEMKQLEKQLLSAVAPEAVPVRINFSKAAGGGSPLIFGGAHYPKIEHTDAWNKIADAGVTAIRVDLFTNYSVPRRITLEDYKSNKNNAQDPANWDRKFIEGRKKVMRAAKERGMKVIAIMDYAPAWLTYTGTEYGVPKDWEVYRDIVAKTYREHRDHIDYLEIWNEPNMPNDRLFLVAEGSGLTRKQAYEKIFLEASQAIRQVDAEIKDGKRAVLGAQVSFTSQESDFLIPLLENPETAKHIDFVSYHHYERKPSRSDKATRDILRRFGREDIPVMQTEWSYSSKGKEVEPVVSGNAGIPYAGSMLVNFLNMQLAGANYHTLTAREPNKPFGLATQHAFYTWENGTATLYPMAKVWRLMSRTLGLGEGPSRVYTREDASNIYAAGFVNSQGREGMVLVNTSREDKLIQITFANVPREAQWRRLRAYVASGEQDGTREQFTQILQRKNKHLQAKIFLPAESVTGILLTDDVALPERVRHQILYR